MDELESIKDEAISDLKSLQTQYEIDIAEIQRQQDVPYKNILKELKSCQRRNELDLEMLEKQKYQINQLTANCDVYKD